MAWPARLLMVSALGATIVRAQDDALRREIFSSRLSASFFLDSPHYKACLIFRHEAYISQFLLPRPFLFAHYIIHFLPGRHFYVADMIFDIFAQSMLRCTLSFASSAASPCRPCQAALRAHAACVRALSHRSSMLSRGMASHSLTILNCRAIIDASFSPRELQPFAHHYYFGSPAMPAILGSSARRRPLFSL